MHGWGKDLWHKFMNNGISTINLAEAPGDLSYNIDKTSQTIMFWVDKSCEKVVEVTLNKSQTEANILGLVLVDENVEVVLKTLQIHASPKTKSNLLVKSVLGGRAKFHFDGIIKVHKQAQLTDAYQRNENLLLSDESKAVSKPALEILANDVRCTHSATVSHLDNEQLFYLESRGLPEKKSQFMLIESYLSPILEKIEERKVKDYLIHRAQQILESAN